MESAALGRAHVPLGEDGRGLYSEATLGCFDVISASTDLVDRAVNEITADTTNGPIVIVDYGTADAGTSLPMISRAIRNIKSRFGDGTEVLVVYEDQPNNEWRSVFYHTQGMKRIPGVQPFNEVFTNVSVLASGVSFHEKCLPKGFAHIGTCFTAMHWLSEKPCDLETALHASMATDGISKFAEQAERDWEHLLVLRAQETKKGGRQVIVNFCTDERGRYLGNTDIGENMHANFNQIWSQMVDEGKITKEEYKRTTFINYYRTLQETQKPFEAGRSAHSAGLRLVSCETKVTRCPFREGWKEKGGRGDAQEHARKLVSTMRTWSNSTFLSALDDSRSQGEKEALVEEMYSRYADRIASEPEKHGMDYVHCYLLVQKL